ncbi:MAG TPA: hypothetical protein VG148_18290 [Pyrinomonadaceae bacterium]|nr:hypothetical protein [Pyrinomonadaceae bacterium]
MPKLPRAFAAVLVCQLLLLAAPARTYTQSPPAGSEYLWFEAENMRGIATDERNEPVRNPSWREYPREKAPGWGMNGPGVSAEWSQGGESEWTSVAASADETRATIFQEFEVPRAGRYRVWVRYADWARRGENFTVRVSQGGRELSKTELGAADRIDPHDEVSMYWGWAFAWDSAPPVELAKGAARLSLEIEKASDARRNVDCVVVTNDPAYVPDGRRKPPFHAFRVLREWKEKRPALAPLVEPAGPAAEVPARWRRRPFGGRDFLMPWNISEKFWPLYDKPESERPLYPSNADPFEAFVKEYKGARDAPIFSSPLVVPVIRLDNLPLHLKEGSAFLRHLRQTRAPFAVNINFREAKFKTPEEARAAWGLLSGELSGQFLGWISGESIGHVWPTIRRFLMLSPESPRRELLESLRAAYDKTIAEKWAGTFKTETGPMWDKLIPAQSTSSTTYAHALGRWGVRTLGMETAAVMPATAMRIAFTRGAARQTGANFFYYHAPNFGDTATTFTEVMNYAGPRYFYHTRYGATMGPSLSWYRKSYYLYYMSGVSAVYLEQGFDQFFKPGPGEHPFQLNPLGRITQEFMRFAERRPDRGVPYTPVAFLLDPAHGFETTNYPHFPFGVSPPDQGDAALRELFYAAYYPTGVVEGEPATADRQAFVNAAFGDIFDVLVASDSGAEAVSDYRAIVVGGRVSWTPAWASRLKDYVRKGGTLVLNAAQAEGLPGDLLGVRLSEATAEADAATCLAPGEAAPDLSGQVFRYRRAEPRGAEVLMRAAGGDALVTVNRVGRGRVVFCAVPDLLGLDGRLTPAAAHLLAHLFAAATPVGVTGDIEHLLNRTPAGWAVTLINNRGVYKQQQGLAHVERGESVDVTIDLRGAGIASAAEWTEGGEVSVAREAGRDLLRVRVPPGGIRIIEIIPR